MTDPQRSVVRPESLRIAAIVPLYNGEAYIEQALQSVLSQRLLPSEIIVVDDGSTDQGPAIVQKLALEHPITLLRKPNGGQAAARNFGIAHSTSELIALLDQDDAWYPNHLNELLKPFLRRHSIELGWVYSNLDEVDERGRLIARSTLRFLDVQHPKRDLHGCLRTDMFVLPSASLISRRAFDAVGGFDERLRGYEDDDLFLRMFCAGYENIYVDKALTRWRIFPGSSSYSMRMGISRMIYFRKLLEEFPDDPRRSRFWTSNLIVPRFFPWLVREFVIAYGSGDKARVDATFDDLCFASAFHKRRVRLTIRLLAPMLRFRPLTSAVFAARPFLQPFVRRILR